jgi:hypothetical protein
MVATVIASTVSLNEREYHHSSSAVMTKAIAKKNTTVSSPSITSPITLAKPTIWMSMCGLLNSPRIFSSRRATSA